MKRIFRDEAALVNDLQQGKVVIMACDTIYGFVGRYPDTEQKIRHLKGREETKPFLLLISSPNELEYLNVENRHLTDPLLELWPGPVTFIFSTRNNTTIACRLPDDERLISLISKLGSPLFSTSVNKSYCQPLNDPVDIMAEFGDVDILLEDSGVMGSPVPSTVVDLSGRARKIIRQGAIEIPEHYLFI